MKQGINKIKKANKLADAKDAATIEAVSKTVTNVYNDTIKFAKK